jgi:histidinol-phosphate aminotransferase
MPVSRRTFVRTVGAGSAGLLALPWVTARGAEAGTIAVMPGAPGMAPFEGDGDVAGRVLAPQMLRLDSNENPYGPAPAVLDAVRDALGDCNRYAYAPTATLRTALARANGGLAEDQVMLGAGSAEVLRTAVLAFTSATRPLVVAVPTYESPARDAALYGHAVREVPVRDDLTVDLDRMAEAAIGAGLVFLCNPNNPTGIVHDRASVEAFIARVHRTSPDTTVLVDEAYHEYVDDPGYGSCVAVAASDPRVVVSRTFSKVHGLAGLRVGWAVGAAPTIAAMRRFAVPLAVNHLGAIAAAAALAQPASHVERQRALNREAREHVTRWFRDQGYAVGPSETNFVVVDIRRDVKAFQAACRAGGVLVGRAFPRMPTRVRISIATLDEMRSAKETFVRALQAV